MKPFCSFIPISVSLFLFFVPVVHAFGHSRHWHAFTNSRKIFDGRHRQVTVCVQSDSSSFRSLDELRNDLLESCDKFRDYQSKLWVAADSKTNSGDKKTVLDPDLEKIQLETISLISQIANLNPTLKPTEGWKETPASNLLEGTWKLRFTTAPDATFKPDSKGPANTMQYVNSSSGTLTNVIEYPENPGPLKDVQVVILGEATSDIRISLDFKKVILHRNTTGLFRTITIPLPSFNSSQLLSFSMALRSLFIAATRPIRLLWKSLRRSLSNVASRTNSKNAPGSAINSSAKTNQRGTGGSRGTYFDVLYLDDDLRIHKTGQGYYFVQTRLYDVWDPMRGWKLISML